MAVPLKQAEIEDLPNEVLEFILSLVPPYKDLHDCMAVSKRWRKCVKNVARTKLRNLRRALIELDIVCETVPATEMTPTISKRYSHAAAIHDNSMFVFGGCTCSMTTFNDVLRLDLSKRQWIRPLAMGNYPSPKACSSLICYKDILVLFGGWAYPPAYPLYQSWHLFNELHVFDIATNRWTCINTTDSPPPMAGHTVSVIGEWMIVFGGFHKPYTAIHCEKSNDVWKLNLETWTWYRQKTSDLKPTGRLGQTQILLDNENILILGGSGGPTLNYYDAWVLNMSNPEVWQWREVEIRGKEYKPTNIWTNPGCKSSIGLQAFNVTDSNRLSRIERLRLLRLAHLCGVRDKLKKKRDEKIRNHYLGVYALDLAHILDRDSYVEWLPPRPMENGPEQTILYTLLEGKSELIMFGGIRKDPACLELSVNINDQISNTLHFIKAPNYII